MPAAQVRLAASQLAVGSFAFHAIGSGSLFGDMDTVGIRCLALTLLEEALSRTGSPFSISASQSTSFNVHELAACTHTVTDALTTCNATAAVFAQLDAALPDYRVLYSLLCFGLINLCFGNAGAALVGAFASALGLHESATAFTFTSPRQLSWWDYAAPDGVCVLTRKSVTQFVHAAQYQGHFPSAFPERHDLWHELSAQSLSSAIRAVVSL